MCQHRARCFAWLPGADELITDLIELGRQWDFLPRTFSPGEDMQQNAVQLGELWEPDYLVLAPDSRECFRLLCGAVCFPSGWDLNEKIGHGIGTIHEAVPGLNTAIGGQVNAFLARMKPGVSWDRVNWGLSRSPELDQHPARKLRRLDDQVGIEEIFFRIEEQSLTPLPKTGGVLFGIRIVVHPLERLKQEPEAARGLAKALETMPEEVARYKGLGSARQRIMQLLVG